MPRLGFLRKVSLLALLKRKRIAVWYNTYTTKTVAAAIVESTQSYFGSGDGP